MSRPNRRLRDAAVAYASRGVPVLPLHYPLPHRHGLRTTAHSTAPSTAAEDGCSCGDRACAQVGKHPLGSLVPHGLKDATCNRARVLAWWTRHPQANIGLATGHRFDVLDVDGPEGAHAIQELAATHGLHSSGPLVRTGGGGWHYYLSPSGLGNAGPAGLEHVDWRGRGGYVVAPPSRHASGHPYQWVPGRDLSTPLAEIPAPMRARLEHRPPVRPAGPVELPATGATGRDRCARAALTQELARVATAPVGHRNRQLWESTRNLYNLVATGALDHREVDQGLLAAAERCGLLAEEPRQTHRTLASGRQVGLATPAAHDNPAAPNATTPRRSRLLERPASGPRRGGDRHARRRPLGRLRSCSRGGRVPPPSRARAHPHHPQEGACMGSHPTLAHHQLTNEAHEADPDDWIHDHHQRAAERTSEQAFDRLNPTFGVPADRSDRIGHRDVARREAALALGVRVAVHDSRQNDPSPIVWQAGQDYRAADALQAAHHQPTRTRRGPERLGPER